VGDGSSTSLPTLLAKSLARVEAAGQGRKYMFFRRFPSMPAQRLRKTRNFAKKACNFNIKTLHYEELKASVPIGRFPKNVDILSLPMKSSLS